MYIKIRSFISLILIIAIVGSLIPIQYTKASTTTEEDTQERFSYALFAGGNEESLKIETNNLTLNGSIHSNGKVIFNSKNANINGKIYAVSGSAITGKNIKDKIVVTENQSTVIISKKIKTTYFTDNCDTYSKSENIKENNVNLSKSNFLRILYKLEEI
jgi:hypothetical protein